METIRSHMSKFTDKKVRYKKCAHEKIEHRTFVRCDTCDVALCLTKDRNCFAGN